MKIATWNVNSLTVRLPHLLTWLGEHPVDVLCLQETKMTDAKFPAAALEEAGYHSVHAGQKTYNGVAILARSPISDVVRNNPRGSDPQQRLISATVDGVRIVNAYMPNGQTLGSEKYAYKMAWLDALRAWLADELQAHAAGGLALLGDFNIAPEERDVHEPAAWENHIHFTPDERAQLAQIAALGLTDAFRLFEQPEKSYSWWDYRNLAFRRNQGLRIDHILLSSALRARCSACVIDRAPRKWEQPSDHVPVVATLA